MRVSRITPRGIFTHHVIEDSLPASIYHYTDAAGLKGIIENGQFWASAVLSLNDRAEYFHGKGHAGSYLFSGETIAKFPKADPERLGSKIDEAELMDGIFVISFTTLADDLGQWRGYGAAGGFAIEFDTAELRKYLCGDPRVTSRLGRVSYDDRGDSPINELDRLMNERETAGTNVELTEVLLAAAMYKRSGWAAEKEVRWVALNHMHSPLLRDSGVRFRPGRYGLTLYMEIPFEPRPYLRNIIKSVTVGPGPFQKESARTLEVIGGAYIEGVASFATHKSKIDLR